MRTLIRYNQKGYDIFRLVLQLANKVSTYVRKKIKNFDILKLFLHMQAYNSSSMATIIFHL